jgi:hypothetical protein
MATYKVLQDIEAEDKLVGPLTLRQCIYAAIMCASLWLGFLSATKHAAVLLVAFVPVAGLTGFFAFPWKQDQPTEVWALAKIRFYLKPRRRVWDQSDAKQLVTITAPKHIERHLTNGLDQDEVRSRLSALAATIDSRGWAVKNMNVNLNSSVVLPGVEASDRLVQASSLPQEVSTVDVRASDDILDARANPVAHHFDSMISASATAHHQQLIAQMQQASAPVAATPATQMGQASRSTGGSAQAQQPADFWFMHPTATVPGQATFTDTPVVAPGVPAQAAISAPQAAVPTAEEEALVNKFKQENSSQTVAYGHMKTLKTPEQLAAEEKARQALARTAAAPAAVAAKPAVTPVNQAVIMNLSNNDDLDVATLARQAKQAEQDSGEVVISLH